MLTVHDKKAGDMRSRVCLCIHMHNFRLLPTVFPKFQICATWLVSPYTLFFVVAHINGVKLCIWTAAMNRPIIHPPDDTWVWRAMVEWYWQGKIEEVRERPISVPLCPQQIPHGLIPAWTWYSVLRSRWLLAWAMALTTPCLVVDFRFWIAISWRGSRSCSSLTLQP
jgi:hypothetical protein